MSDAATNFARGAELQSSLMARVVQSNIAQQQAEQQRAMLPLRLQSMEVENEMNRLQITAQGYKNQVDAAKVSDQEALAGGLAALASGRDPGQLALKTPEANSAWLNARAHSAVGQTLSEITHNFATRASAKGLPPDLVSKALSYPRGQDGTIAPEAWKALDSAEKVAAQNAALEAQKAAKYKSDLQIEEDKSKVKLQNQGRLDAVIERAKLVGTKSVGSGANAATVAAYGIKKASYLRQVDVIKADPTLSSEAKMARIEDLQQKFESEIAAVTAGPDSTPSPVTQPIDPSVRDEIEINNEQIKTLLRSKADLVAKMAAGEGGKTLGVIGDGYAGKLKSTQKQIEALRAQNASLMSGGSAPSASAATSGEPRKMVVKQDGTTVRDGNVVFKPSIAEASQLGTTAATVVNGSTPRLMPPQTGTEASAQPQPGVTYNDNGQLPLSPADEVARMIDANVNNPTQPKDAVATAFWEVVADKLGVQPQQIGGSNVARKPRTVAKNDPRIRKYYEQLPVETQNAILDEVIKKARENPKASLPSLFDYMLIK